MGERFDVVNFLLPLWERCLDDKPLTKEDQQAIVDLTRRVEQLEKENLSLHVALVKAKAEQ